MDDELNRVISEVPELIGLKFDEIKKVLGRQSKLKILEIIRGSFFAEPFELSANIQLQKMVLFMPWSTSTELANMHKFVTSQMELNAVVFNILSEQDLSFNYCLDHILQLPTLKDLRLVFYDQPQMNAHFQAYRFVNTTVEDVYLGLQGITDDHFPIIITACRIFPKVQKIHLNFDGDVLLEMPENVLTPLTEMKHIDTLTIERCISSFLRENLCIPTLKKFIGQCVVVSFVEDWVAFFRNNQAIEELRLQFSPFCDFDLAQTIESAITILPNLKSIRVCSREQLTLEEQQKLKVQIENSNSLKSVTFCKFQVIKLDGNRIVLRQNDGTIGQFPEEPDIV